MRRKENNNKIKGRWLSNSRIPGIMTKSARETTRKWFTTVMAGMVFFTTTYSLILPAITLDQERAADMAGVSMGTTAQLLKCEMPIHQHDDSCYDVDGNLICGRADYVLHQHDAGCYDVDGNLVCELDEADGEEHIHTVDCYGAISADEKGLDPLEEGWVETDEGGNVVSGDPAHLVCGELEVREHQHGDECFVEDNVQVAEEAQSASKAEEAAGEAASNGTEGDSSGSSVDTDATGQVFKQVEDGFSENPEVDSPIDTLDEMNADAARAAATEPKTATEKEQEADVHGDKPKTLEYEGSDCQIVVSCDETAEIPANAALYVREIVEEDQEYDVYYNQTMDTIGVTEGAPDSVEAVAEKVLSTDGAHLSGKDTQVGAVTSMYARFFDIEIQADGQKIEPKGEVTVNIVLNDAPEESNVTPNVVHFADDGDVQVMTLTEPTSETTEASELQFTTDGFSVYSVVYTVDFHYEINGKMYEFSLPGGEKIALSDVVEVLGILDGTNFEDAEAFLAEVADVEFSDESLVKVTKNEEDDDWTLESLQAFDTEESLTITMKNGDVVTVKVTDDQEGINLAPMLQQVDIIDSNGNPLAKPWAILPGNQYTLQLKFAETSGVYQFSDDDTPMVYTLPSALNLGNETFTNTFSVDMGDDGILEGNTYTYDPSTNRISVVWNTSSPVFDQLISSGNAAFELSVNTFFAENISNIIFSDTVTVAVEDYHLAEISKEGSYQSQDGKINYTVIVTNTGNSSNVRVKDVLSGTILDYKEGDTVNWVSSNGTSHTYTITALDVQNDSFELQLGALTNGEIVTITYSSCVDYSRMSHVVNNIYENTSGYVSTEEETLNTATVSADDQADLSASWKTEEITSETLKKSGRAEAKDENTQIIHWTAIVNEEALASLAGQTITDTISNGSRSITTYDTSTPVKIQVYNQSGALVDTRMIEWENTEGFSYSQSQSWSYQVPATDKAYKYVITYDSLVNIAGQGSNPTIQNRITVHNHGPYANVTVSGGSDVFKIAKVVDKDAAHNTNGWDNEYEYWKITITVPAAGSTEAHLFEILPGIKGTDGTWLYDELDTSYGVNGFIVTGLLDGESYTTTNTWLNDVDKTIRFDFYQDENKTTKGFLASAGSRLVTIQLRTKLNQTWLDMYPNTGNGTNPRHQNRGWLYVNNDNDTRLAAEANLWPYLVRPLKNGTYAGTVAIDRVDYPVFSYTVDFQGIKDILDTQPTSEMETFKTETLRKWFTAQEKFDTDILRYLDVNNEDDAAILRQIGADMNTVERLLRNGSTGSGQVGEYPATWDGNTLTLKFHDFEQIPRDNREVESDYVFNYYLIVKDADALHTLQQSTNNGATAASLTNTISYTYNGVTSSATVQYTYKPVSKSMDSYDEDSRKAHYRIVLNEAKETLNNGNPMTMTDEYTNMSVDFETIRITTDPAAVQDQVGYTFSGNTGTYTIPDSTKVVIEYDATVIGQTGNTVIFTNTASLLTYSDSTSTTKTLTSSGSGTSTNYRIRLLKYESGNMSKRLKGAVFQLYKATPGSWDPDTWTTEGAPMTFLATETSQYAYTSGEGGFTHAHASGDPIYFITDSNGMINVQLNENTDGISLQKGERYFLVETKAPEGYERSTVHWSFQIEDTADYRNLVYHNNDTMTVANEPITDQSVILKKVGVNNTDQSGTQTNLGGAKFTIYKATGDNKDTKGSVATVDVNGTSTELKNLTSDINTGIFWSGTLPAGDYLIEEVEEPAGYNRMSVLIKMTVGRDGVSLGYVGTVGTPPYNEPTKEGDVWTITLINIAGISLPATGGFGTLPYTLGGLMLVIASALMYGFSKLYRKRKE